MGQYHLTVNLDKKEFLDPHTLGDGLKLLEQFNNSHPGIRSALVVLLACSNGRGSGDLPEDPLVGHWSGDRIAVVGDYSEPEDIPGYDASLIYDACRSSVFYPCPVTMPLQSLNPDDTFWLPDETGPYSLAGDRYDSRVAIRRLGTLTTRTIAPDIEVATRGNPYGMWCDQSYSLAAYFEFMAGGHFVSNGSRWRRWQYDSSSAPA